jgi:plastocyanin
MRSFDFGIASLFIRATVLLAVLIGPNAAHAQWRATVGAQSWDSARQALAFLPNELWIHAGDDVTWTFQAGEIHTVTFLATSPTAQVRPPFQVGCPGFTGDSATFDGTTCISTPPLVKGASFKVAFPAVGNFKLVCLVHPDMTGVVHVVEKGKLLPHDQTFYDAEAYAQADALLSDVGGADFSHNHSGERVVVAGTGEISGKAAGSQTLSVMRFMSHNMVIHAGQTVEWDNEDPEDPHTITFGTEPAGDPFPPSANVTVDADGARNAVINSPSDSVHSGFILAAPQDRTGLAQSSLSVTRFRVTFTHAGTYPYICALHDLLGMKGKIIVLP